MFASLFALIAVTIAAPPSEVVDVAEALNVAAHAEGSPERAYLELVCDVREGRYDQAYARLQPPPARFVEVVREALRQHHLLEKLKAKLRHQFGEDAVDLWFGFYPHTKLRTIGAIIDGDSAVLTFVNKDGKPERSDISLKKVDGRWLVPWHGMTNGGDEEIEKMTDEELADTKTKFAKFSGALANVSRRVDADEFKDVESVLGALMEEMAKE